VTERIGFINETIAWGVSGGGKVAGWRYSGGLLALAAGLFLDVAPAFL